jgi:hypothetical protein
MVAPRSKIMAVANGAGEERAMIGGGLRREQWWPGGDWDGRARRLARRFSAF